ncbi:MAG: tRNA pseudouridine(38-40) synthase TruA [Oscillospiraceae bacterium]|nr:tRNA pseudouridine(38-40) synthase TruA [Oscillospiraceae bacterium]
MMNNLKLFLRYDGTPYHGWQMQENAVSVQGELTKAAERILGHRPTIYGCSRTDKGVHANIFCCNFRTPVSRDCEKIAYGFNAVLPESISVLSCEYTDDGFNARFDCRGKEYIYKIWNDRRRNPFLLHYALHYPYELDTEMLNRQCADYIGTHDFTSFCAAGSSAVSNVRTVFDCDIQRQGSLVTFRVHGDGFLYNMVRIMVGTLLDINAGKLEKDSIPQIILEKNRLSAGVTAKAHGLYLNKVYYD